MDPAQSDSAFPVPPADGDGLVYDTDLLALAGATGPAPDPQLEAELAGFAALDTEQRADRTDLEETR